jgi:hypothetical protein
MTVKCFVAANYFLKDLNKHYDARACIHPANLLFVAVCACVCLSGFA